jgi:hypothetical protein
LGVTVAAKVTPCPIVAGFGEEVSATLDVSGFTVCVSAGEVFPASLESPL